MIYFKNTLTGTLYEFKPITPHVVGMYNCGPTVYNKAHIGNMRPYVIADLLKNVLIYNGYSVKQVINITDVGHLTSDGDEGDDKVESQAQKEHLSARIITQKYTDYFLETLQKLNITTDETLFPRATDHIPEQINFIHDLEKNGFTYQIDDGIYFDTSKFPEYGKLGHIDIAGLQEGARIVSNSQKRNVTDFALWKFSKTKRQQEWDSPWGKGFPGWHIECSAMSQKYLGDTFDIHTGGVDHIPTHHNNEIAQSESVHHAPLANYWIHINHILVNGQKISKSIPDSTIYIEDLIAKNISACAYKYWLYTSHYSTLSNFSFEAVEASQKAYDKLVTFVQSHASGTINEHYLLQFNALISKDLDTPKAIALFWEMMKDDSISNEDKRATLLEFDTILKLNLDSLPKKTISIEIPTRIIGLAKRRQTARIERDYARADALREEIEREGFKVKDTDSEDGFVILKM